eukprot:TRINITY_DN5117_c0_g1_i1.p1 TRINITY_DN5117_c0_g1~~TRINITY_DN5117_c0_g1_i1.p1  ORF type:complete len:154 (+),score=36.50 TRINITY_DN5117_c0_g1_i1:59-463(+)
MGSSGQTSANMKQTLGALSCAFVIFVSGVQGYHPNLLNLPSSRSQLPYGVEYGLAAKDAKMPGNWTSPGGCIVGSMALVLSVPTDPKDASKMIDISVDPSTKNITVTGKCPENATSQELTLSWEDVDHDDKRTY